MSVKLLTEHHLAFLSLKGGCRGSSESTLVIMSNYWKSHAAAHIIHIHLSKIYGLHYNHNVSPSVCLSLCPLVKMFTTLEPHSIFDHILHTYACQHIS